MNFAVSTSVVWGSVLPQVDFKALKVGDFITLPRKLTKEEYRTLLYKAKRQNKRIATKTLDVGGKTQVLVQIAGNVAEPQKFWEIEYYLNDKLTESHRYYDFDRAKAGWDSLATPSHNEDYIFMRKETGANGRLETTTIGAQ